MPNAQRIIITKGKMKGYTGFIYYKPIVGSMITAGLDNGVIVKLYNHEYKLMGV